MGSLVIIVSDEFGGSDLGYLGFKSSHLILSLLFFLFFSWCSSLLLRFSFLFFLFFTVFLIIFDHFLSCLFFSLGFLTAQSQHRYSQVVPRTLKLVTH